MALVNLLADEQSAPVNLLADDKQESDQAWYSRYPRDLASGLLEGARGIGNIPHMLHLPYAPYFEPTDFNKIVGLKGEPGVVDNAFNILGQFAPALLAPEASLGKVGTALEKIPKYGKYIKSILGNAIPQSAYALTQDEDSPVKSAAEAGVVSAPFSAAATAVGSKSPLIRALGRMGAGSLGAAGGYFGAQALGLPQSLQNSAAAIGGGIGLVGKSPKSSVLKQIAEGIDGTNYKEKLAAAQRLGLSHLTPAEASGNPFLASLQGQTGKSEGGSKLLYERGQARVEQEKSAIDKLFNTIHTEELIPKTQKLYKQAYEAFVPEEKLMSLQDNEVYKRAQKIVNNKPAFKESLKGVDENSVAYLDHVKKAMDDMIETAERQGANSEARIMKQTREKLLEVTDETAPVYKQARQQAERQITRRNLEKKVNEYDLKGTNFFRAALNNDKRFNELMHSVRNAPGAMEQLKDMRLIFRDLINPPSVRTSAGFTKAGMNQARNTKNAYIDMVKGLFKGKGYDAAMVNLITNPKWSDEIKKINKLNGYDKKLMKTIQLMGKAASIKSQTNKNNPMELELTEYNVRK